MAGLRELVEEQRVHCPHCHRPIDLTEFANELFQRILRTIATGERVFIAQFGSFTARYVPGHPINHFGVVKKVEGRKVIRFRAAANSKTLVNEMPAEKEAQRDERRQQRQSIVPTDLGRKIEPPAITEVSAASTASADEPGASSITRRHRRSKAG